MNNEDKYKEALERARECMKDGGISQNTIDYLCNIFPELKESEDERIRGAIIDHLKDNNLTEWASWLEKQNKKIEPTFKVGDWVCNGGGNPCKVNDIFGNYYELCSTEGYQYSKPVSDIDKTFHLWTIEDARDSDILATKNAVFIFKHIDKTGLNLCRSYCEVIDNSELGFGFDFSINSVYPATKEQRDTLLTKMKEDGYEWNAEKKEMKKVEDEPKNYKQQVMSEMTDLVKDYIKQKPSWSEEDEQNLKGIIDEIEANKNSAPSYDLPTYDKFLNWLKSLKKKIINE